MREILFRGKRLDNGEWIVGYYVRATHHWHKHGVHEDWIIAGAAANGGWFAIHERRAVDPATVGQFTGLTDKNGKKIFEGDIIKSHYVNVLKADFVEEVVFHNGRFCALYQKDGCKMWQSLADGVPHHPQDKMAYMEWCEVIGNIHDNPELLREKE